jgi:hypothetical protein
VYASISAVPINSSVCEVCRTSEEADAHTIAIVGSLTGIF